MIGPKTLNQIKEEFGGLLDNYAKQISDAYLANDMELDVRLSAKLRGAGGGNTAIKAEIAFVESRVKDSAEVFVDEKQQGLFSDEALADLEDFKRKLGPGESATFEYPGYSPLTVYGEGAA